MDTTRKLLLVFAGVLVMAPPMRLGVLHGSQAYGQAVVKTNIDDIWQGTLHVQKDLRTILKISKAPDGTLSVFFTASTKVRNPSPPVRRLSRLGN